MTITEFEPEDDIFVEADREDQLKAAGMALGKAVQSVVTAPESGADRIKKLFGTYQGLPYGLPFEILSHIELISRYNPDYSQAVDNIKTLANSGHNLFVEGSSELAQRKSKETLEELSRTVQDRHGGIDGLVDKLLNQAAVYGAMCGEWIISDELDRVVDFADINPKSIKFFWEPENNGFFAYQEVKPQQAKVAEENGQKVMNKRFIRLNPITFHYFAFDAAPASPYGVPPFLASLRNISIQMDMVENMSQIVKKMGLLGIVDMTVKALTKRRQETDEAFVLRATKFLEDYATVAEAMVTEGGIVHFDDAEVKTSNITGAATGATNIFKQNEEQVFSGLKSMPSVQGRSYSTTETYAGVSYDIIIRNTKKYQRSVKRMIESGYRLHLDLSGNRATKVTLQFNENKTLQRLQNAQARQLEIKAALMMWAMGVWDQMDAAQSLGESGVKTEYVDVPDSHILGNTSPGGGSGASSTDDGTEGTNPGDQPGRPRSDQLPDEEVITEIVESVIENSGLIPPSE